MCNINENEILLLLIMWLMIIMCNILILMCNENINV